MFYLSLLSFNVVLFYSPPFFIRTVLVLLSYYFKLLFPFVYIFAYINTLIIIAFSIYLFIFFLNYLNKSWFFFQLVLFHCFLNFFLTLYCSLINSKKYTYNTCCNLLLNFHKIQYFVKRVKPSFYCNRGIVVLYFIY